MRTMLLPWLAWFALAVPAQAATVPLPADSVYQSGAQLTDAHARRFAWREDRGQARIVTMLYTSCKFVCPMIVDTAMAIEQQLTADERAQLRVTMISLDPARDTPEALANMARERGIDTARWTLARPQPKDVRSIAGLLGVRYRALADGEFNHTTVLVLLDADGRIVARTERVGARPDPAFVAAVKRTLAH
ncbi:MAG: SCO family protein [Betaproteobacteria bacterium]